MGRRLEWCWWRDRGACCRAWRHRHRGYPGSYRILITNDAGCQGQRVFNVEQVTQVIPEITIPPVCDSLYSVQFSGGYTTPDAGPLLIYMTAQTLGLGG